MRRLAVALLAIVVAACQDAGPTAPAITPQPLAAGLGAPVDMFAQKVPVDISVPGFCIGETLAVSGTLNTATTVWASGDRLRIKSHLSGNLKAVGLTTGLSYQYQQVTATDAEFETTTGASETDQVYLFRVISRTGAPDYHVVMNGTLRYDPVNGSSFEPRRWAVVCR